MALKGTALIELTNVKTGEVERYEEHNLFTKALEYMHQPIGGLKSPTAVTSNGNEPVYSSLLGGLVLWDSNIEESDTVIAQPHGVKAVGCASYDKVNTTTSPRRGSYNAAESALTVSDTEKSMKFVYDFATSQANGTIKCVSLTNWQAGWNGFGGNENVDDFIGSYANYDSYMGHDGATSQRFVPTSNNYKDLFLIDPDEDVFYEVSSLTVSSLTISKRKANINQKSVFTNQHTVHDLVESRSIALPTTLSGADYFICNYEPKSNLLYIVVRPTSSNVASGGTFYVITVNMETYAATVYTLKNPISSTLYISTSYIVCSDGCLHYMYKEQYYIRSISLADGTYKSTYLQGGYCYNTYCSFLANEMVYFRVLKKSGNTSAYCMARFDPVGGTCEFLGYIDPPEYFNNFLTPIKGHPLYYYYSGHVWLNTNYLATINNLSRPIEKTSDKTMKITYTITEI